LRAVGWERRPEEDVRLGKRFPLEEENVPRKKLGKGGNKLSGGEGSSCFALRPPAAPAPAKRQGWRRVG
jgi:hypothetical protein